MFYFNPKKALTRTACYLFMEREQPTGTCQVGLFPRSLPEAEVMDISSFSPIYIRTALEALSSFPSRSSITVGRMYPSYEKMSITQIYTP